MPYTPHQSIMNIIGGQYFERWPDEEQRLILYTPVFTYEQRLTALTFLFGNVRDVDLVYAALRKQIGMDPDPSAPARPGRSITKLALSLVNCFAFLTSKRN